MLKYPHETPNLDKLLKRIIEHRRECIYWKGGNYCHDCHNMFIGAVEREVNELRTKN